MLIRRFERHEAHVRLACGLVDRFGIQLVVLHVLTAFAVRRCELRRDQADFMVERVQLASQ
ncbi:hypothetical protein AB4156_31385 [Cupriavidus sp. 2MCAB6]|uniref:hypothetical protein n=1 Tax=Cupriavidus sp. 2MCAB6 TaxID=3232981 RepID=UPI003F924011